MLVLLTTEGQITLGIIVCLEVPWLLLLLLLLLLFFNLLLLFVLLFVLPCLLLLIPLALQGLQQLRHTSCETRQVSYLRG
jgi:hypothetical protein